MTIPFTIQLVGVRELSAYESPEAEPSADSLSINKPSADSLSANKSSATEPQTDNTPLIDTVTACIADFLHHVDAVFSPFRRDSQVTAARHGDWSALLNRHEPEFAEVYALAQQAESLTHGYFNPMHSGEYDPTGIVKGWAIQRAYEQWLRPLIHNGTCEAAALGGGGDIQTGVADASDFTWRIGVQDPRDERHILRTVALRNGAIATSGTSKRGEHITRAAHDLLQATVVDDCLTFADMWATTAISAGEHVFRDVIAQNDAARTDVMAVLVRTDGSIAEITPYKNR